MTSAKTLIEGDLCLLTWGALYMLETDLFFIQNHKTQGPEVILASLHVRLPVTLQELH